jgi:hypothetical protein
MADIFAIAQVQGITELAELGRSAIFDVKSA